MDNIISPYLKVTISDNDFYLSQQALGTVLQETFLTHGYPTTESLQVLKDCIGQMWYAIRNVRHILHSYTFGYHSKEETPFEGNSEGLNMKSKKNTTA